MLNVKALLFVVVIAACCEVYAASLYLAPVAEGADDVAVAEAVERANRAIHPPFEVARGRVREGAPPPVCSAGRCASPIARAGPVCAFDAAGTARTFGTLCELEAVSCRESTYYAITSLGEC